MCIRVLTQYACGHAGVEYMNRHCQCALIVGPVVEKRGRCGRRECGGLREMGSKVEVEEERYGGRDEETVEMEKVVEKNVKVGM